MSSIDAALLTLWLPTLGLIVQEKALRVFIEHCVSTWYSRTWPNLPGLPLAFPSVFAYWNRSNTGGGKGLGTRLVKSCNVVYNSAEVTILLVNFALGWPLYPPLCYITCLPQYKLWGVARACVWIPLQECWDATPPEGADHKPQPDPDAALDIHLWWFPGFPSLLLQIKGGLLNDLNSNV